ncbi:MAG: nucleotidyltransferase domain-containing protein [Candidatus Bathyarchaeota archaeon]|nr:nucleotidyltransferase domain-containing protein [Candidatus Bathyarchaeota archaeon]
MVENTTNCLKILTLYRTDYEANFHIRAMAKLLGTSHVTLLPHLKHLEQTKILQHKTVGRNKQYLLNKANILTKYYLTAAEQLETISYLEKTFIIKKLAEHLSNIENANSLILFGSYASATAIEQSDIDLFCIGTLTKEHVTQIKKFEATYGKKINTKTATAEDFKMGLRTGDLLTKEIIRNHIILCNPDQFVTILWRTYVER